MTDKPDVAALVEWLQTCSPVTENGKRAHLAASELTRLAAERDTCIAGNVDMVRNAEAWEAKCNTAWAERDAAKAEIARLREALKPFAESAAYFDVFGIYGGVPVRHLRDARAALNPAKDAEPVAFACPKCGSQKVALITGRTTQYSQHGQCADCGHFAGAHTFRAAPLPANSALQPTPLQSGQGDTLLQTDVSPAPAKDAQP